MTSKHRSDDGLADVEFLVEAGPHPSDDVIPPEEALEVGSTRRTRRLGLLGQAIVLVAALAAGGAWYLTRPASKPTFSFGGKTIDNAAKVITRADNALVRFTRTQHGALSTHAGCYFNRVGTTTRTDVAQDVYCGPVLFFGGRAPEMYLQFPLAPSGRAAARGHLKLDVGARPVSATPDRLPRHAKLVRPDQRAAPIGADGLLTPKPPPAARDLILRVHPAELPALPGMPDTAAIISRNIDIRLRGSGVLPYFGSGGHARSAFPGQKLLAVALEVTDGDTDYLINALRQPTIDLVVDGGAARPLPLALIPNYNAMDLGRFLVLGVPANASDVELVVRDAGVTQQLSLLTGVQGKDNIKILQRPYGDRISDVGDDRYLTGQVTIDGKTTTADVELSVDQLILGYFSFYGPEHASGPDRALLTVAMCARVPSLNTGTTSACFPLDGTNVVLTPKGGTPIRARQLHGQYVYEVAASFTRGTLTIPTVMKNEAGWTIAIAHPYRVPVIFTS